MFRKVSAKNGAPSNSEQTLVKSDNASAQGQGGQAQQPTVTMHHKHTYYGFMGKPHIRPTITVDPVEDCPGCTII